MKSKLINAIEQGDNMTYTVNGAATNKSTLNPVLDMFSLGGAMRNKSDKDIISVFSKAYNANPLLALKCLFYLRDVRGGQGERRFFRVVINHLSNEDSRAVRANLSNVAEYGRWDDLFQLRGTKCWQAVIKMLEAQFTHDVTVATGDGKKSISLLGKWLPSVKSAGKKNPIAKELYRAFGMDERTYRKTLKVLRHFIDVTEQKMCAKRFDLIDYEKVPSRASMVYRKAFDRHDITRRQKFLEKVEKGEAKIQTKALYPYDLVNKAESGYDRTIEAQWANLPNYVQDSGENFITVVDTSGSMYGHGKEVSPIQIAISLGLYLSERATGLFKDHFITFSESPTLQKVIGNNLSTKISNLKGAEWGMNTNLQATFDLILNNAVKHRIPQDEMPTTVLIVSDMEFDACTTRYGRTASTNLQAIKTKFKQAGYTCPKLVFWRVDVKVPQQPMTIRDDGVCCVSGCSPTVFKNVCNGEMIDPIKVMLNTLQDERYDKITY